MMPNRLHGKMAVVTGAASGIGRAIAEAFVGEGAVVWALDRDDARLAAAVASTPQLRQVRIDLLDVAAITAMPRQTGPADIVVNCAAVFARGSLLECDIDQWNIVMDIDVRAPFALTKAYMPGMLAAGGGSVVNIASVASTLMALPARFVYMTAKAAILGMTKSVALDYLARGVRCNAICPGTIETDALTATIAASPDPEATRQRYLAQQPNGRFGTPAEVAAMAVYLASDESKFTTGGVFVVDGGMSL